MGKSYQRNKKIYKIFNNESCFDNIMTEQKLNSISEIELIEVSSLLTIEDKIIIKNNPNVVYALPLVDSQGKFQGFRQLNSKVDSSFKVLQNDSLGSQLLPIVTGG